MTLHDFLSQDNTSQAIHEIITSAKEKNTKNPAVLTRDDDYVKSHQEQQFSKKLQ